MGNTDPQHDQDRERLAKIYAEMDESELEDTAYHAGRFNDVARQALKEAIAARGLNIQVEDDFKRPRSVTILALFVFLNAAFCLLLVVLAFTRPELILTAHIGRHRPSPGDLKYAILSKALFFDSIAAVVFTVIGFGVWSLSWWARWALLFSAGGSLARWGVGLVATLLFDPRNSGPALASVRPIGLLLNGAILYILIQPEVKRVFGEPPGLPGIWPEGGWW